MARQKKACLVETLQRLQVVVKRQESKDLDPQRCAAIPPQVVLPDCGETALL